MRVRVFLRVFGTLLKLLGGLMLVPAGVSLLYGEIEGVIAFLLPALFTFTIGLLMAILGEEEVLTNKEGFALVAFGWLGAAATGALPFVLLGLSPMDALFESMSGFTTTGASILSESGADGLFLINATAASSSLAVALVQIASNQSFMPSAVGPSTFLASNASALNDTILNAAFAGGLSGNATNLTSNLIEPTYRGLLFWRCFTNWIGGMGIIVLFIAILPNLGVAGRQLFNAEVPGPTEDLIRPRIKQTAKILWGVYMVLTAAEFLLLMLAKMPAYDAICTTFSTVATGGFSPRAESIAYYSGPGYNGQLIEVVVILFMFVCGANFALHYRTMYVSRKSLIKDPEFKFYSLIVLASILVITLIGGIDESLPPEGLDLEGFDLASLRLRTAAFQTVSIITTTGFATADYDLWSSPARLILFLLMLSGACAGSTAGAMKVVRILLALQCCRRELFRTLHPKAVMAVKLKGAPVREDVLRSILIFMAIYILIFAIGSALFAAVCTLAEEETGTEDRIYFVSGAGVGLEVVGGISRGWAGAEGPEDGICFGRGGGGIDMISACSAVATCLGNVGPGLHRFGPTDNFSEVPGIGKLILILCMWMGRLEVLTVLVLLIPDFWKG